MSYTILDILRLIGAIGFFIYGMKIMSEGIQKLAGQQMRRVLNAVTSNSVYSFFSGLLTTVIVQASSATTVMVVGFAHAGLLTLKQSIGVIIGANVGTTIKAILWATFGFAHLELSAMALPMIALAFPLFFSSKQSLKSWSEFLIGFAILFMAIDFIKMAVPQLSPEVLRFVTQLNTHTLASTLFFILLGTLITVAIQSSSTAFALTLVLCNQGLIDFEAAVAIVLGENIGTTVTANVAAIVANHKGKRAALAHTMHNVLGVLFILPVNHWFMQSIDRVLVYFGEPSPYSDIAGIGWAITAYHIAFNVITGFVNLLFLGYFAKLIEKMIPERKDTGAKLAYVGSGFMSTPELALLEVYPEVLKAGKSTAKLSDLTLELLEETRLERQRDIYMQIRELEQYTDVSKKEIINYLDKLREDEVSVATANKAQALQGVINNLERVADVYVQISKVFARKKEGNIYFLPEQREALKDLMKLIERAFAEMLEHLENPGKQTLAASELIEKQINEKRDELKIMHQRGILEGDFNTKSALIFSELYDAHERIGDFIFRVSNAMSSN